MEVYSNRNYKPIASVETKYYKSPQLRKNQDSSMTLGVAVSGGGSRAQYFGLGVLIGLDEIKYGANEENSFIDEIDYFSTVSGGGYAVGYYLTLKKIGALEDYTNFYDYWKSDRRKDSLKENLFKSASKSSVLKMWFYERNMVRTPYPVMIDKHLLQYGKTFQDKKIDRQKLSDYFVSITSTEDVKTPFFVTNGTIYNNGERLPFMPHIIDSLNISASLLPEEEFKELANGFGLPLTYAITGSAAFPGALPMLKFKIKGDDDSVIRVLDGGAVDNLGFTTLFELLYSDKENLSNTKALIIDCSGYGDEIQTLPDSNLSIKKLLEKSLLYTVDVKRLYAAKDIEQLANQYDINTAYIKKIGYSTIKKEFFRLKKIASETSIDAQEKIKNVYESDKQTWDKAYKVFYDELKGDFNFPSFLVSEIPTDEFNNFNLSQVFQLFELSAQVETKVKIKNSEKEILILAGRYTVFLEKSAITKLIAKN